MVLLRRRKIGAESVNPDVRSRLLRAADEILGTEGIQALTQTRVAEAAGVRQSHLTYYFATRSALVRALVEMTATGVMSEFTAEVEGRQVTFSEMRQRLIDCLSDPKMARRILGILISTDEDPTLLAVLDELEAHICASMAQSLREHGLEVSDADTKLLHSTLIGIALRSFNRTSEQALHQTQTLIGDTFDRLVAMTGPSSNRSRKLAAVAGRKP